MTTLNDLNVKPKAVQETKTDKYNVILDNAVVDYRVEKDDAMRLLAYYKERGHTDAKAQCVEFNEMPDYLVSLEIHWYTDVKT